MAAILSRPQCVNALYRFHMQSWTYSRNKYLSMGIHQSLVDSSHNWPLTCRWDFMTPMWYHCNLITIWCSQQGIPILMRYFYIELSPNILIKDVNYTENTPYSLSIWYHSQEHGYLDIVFKDWYHSNASTCRSILHEEKLYGWIQKHHTFF